MPSENPSVTARIIADETITFRIPATVSVALIINAIADAEGMTPREATRFILGIAEEAAADVSASVLAHAAKRLGVAQTLVDRHAANPDENPCTDCTSRYQCASNPENRPHTLPMAFKPETPPSAN